VIQNLIKIKKCALNLVLSRVFHFVYAQLRGAFVGDGKGDLWAAQAAGVPFVAIDPDTGEFDGEEGFGGPFTSLVEWGRHPGLI
jgi:hypothetical protein